MLLGHNKENNRASTENEYKESIYRIQNGVLIGSPEKNQICFPLFSLFICPLSETAPPFLCPTSQGGDTKHNSSVADYQLNGFLVVMKSYQAISEMN